MATSLQRQLPQQQTKIQFRQNYREDAANDNKIQGAANDNEREIALAAQEAEQEAFKEQEEIRYRRFQAAKRAELGEAQQKVQEAKASKSNLLRYAPAFLAALLKDFLDLIGIGSIPALGTVVTLCFALLIFMLLLLAKTNSTLTDSRFVIRRAVALICGSMVEGFIFGLNFLPIQTITVYVIYWLDRHFSDEQIKRFSELAERLRLMR